jgi:hypothetical protein
MMPSSAVRIWRIGGDVDDRAARNHDEADEIVGTQVPKTRAPLRAGSF